MERAEHEEHAGPTRAASNRSGLLWVAALLAALLAQGCVTAGPRGARVASEADPTSVRPTSEGPVVGFRELDGSHAWLGLPFAQPPVGDLRWRAPRTPPRRSGRLEATAFASPCTQLAVPIAGVEGRPGSVVGSEDCLYLNIWAPAWRVRDVPRGEDRLPVMVWVHGGGNAIGAASQFPGNRLASEQGVIVVSVSYRLGQLGWLAHPALRETAEDPADASANYGTLDLIRALEWVQTNIAGFGGDPARVTLFGESAGGLNAFSLLAARRAERLYSRVIIQSGRPRTIPIAEAENRTDQSPAGSRASGREMALRLLVKRGRAPDREAAIAVARDMPAAEMAAFLRGATPQEWYALYEGDVELLQDVPLVLADGDVLPSEPLDVYLRSPRGLPQVPVLMGTNRDELRIFQFVTGKRVRRLFGLFPRARDPEEYVRSARYGSRMWKAVGADEVATAWVDSGVPEVWVYRFDWDEQPAGLWGDLGTLIGASHAMELPFVFGRFELGGLEGLLFTESNAPGRLELSRTMMSYWTAFAASGDPGRGRNGALPRWRAWSEAALDSPRFMVLDTPQGGGLRMSDEAVTRDRLAKELAEDPSYPTPEERCALVAEVQPFGEWQPAQLERLGCADEEAARTSSVAPAPGAQPATLEAAR